MAGNLDEGDGYCLTNNSRDGLNREFSYPASTRAPTVPRPRVHLLPADHQARPRTVRTGRRRMTRIRASRPAPVAVVTGVSSGIGEAIAGRLLDRRLAWSAAISRRRPGLEHRT